MKVTVERAALLSRSATSIAWSSGGTRSRSCPTCCSGPRRAASSLRATDLDLEVTETSPPTSARPARPRCRPTSSTTSSASCPTARRSRWRRPATPARCTITLGPLALHPAGAAGEPTSPISPPARCRTRFTLPAGELKRLIEKTSSRSRPRRRATTSTASICTRSRSAASRCCAPSPPTATAWPASRSPRRRAPTACPASSCRARRSAEIQKLVEDAGEAVEHRAVRRQDPLHLRPGGADLEADRRHLPRLPARHPGRQRQAPDRRQAREFAAAVDRVSTISSERGRAVKLALADGRLTLSVTNPDSGSGDRGDSRSITTPTRSISASTPATSSTSPRQLDGDTALFKLADPGSPTLDPGPRGRRRALRPDADAGLRRPPPAGAALPASLPLARVRGLRPVAGACDGP